MLVTIKDELGIRTYFLNKSYYLIGRGSNSSLKLYSPYVSRHHAILTRTKDRNYIIEDGDGATPSANGLFLKKKKIYRYSIKNGDKILFGKDAYIVFEFSEIQKNEFIQDEEKITLIEL